MKQRTITAIVAILLFFPFVFYSGWPFYLLIYILATIGVLELLRMRKTTIYPIPTMFTLILLWALLFPYTEENPFFEFDITKSEIILMVVLLLLAYTVLVKNKFTFDDAGFLLLSGLYVGLGFYYFMETRDADQGLKYVFYAIVVILSTDTGAYIFGRLLGKRKLWPEISPNKTIEGAIGGMLLAAIVAITYHTFVDLPHSYVVILIVTVLASAVGQIGDLVESAFKRHYEVKDSGTILPGHGGILDRFDSWIFIFPFLHFIHFVS
ncbi:phosphatidate cytidylyltransferase [Radiobacillus sp. PE A8.2]|uniref:phosphatidate cytidylyltransferase n=1 Tax=Radiobacillus sp. PE A8.2 TaxID=3380349 RepID=UPI00388ECE8B